MTIKRRSFLSMLGAAFAAPVLPMPASARLVPAAATSSAAMHGAMLYARTQSSFSVWGLSKSLNVTTSQAESLMVQLSERGILGPLHGSSASGRWAVSNILQRPFGAAMAAKQSAQNLGAQDTEPKFTTEAARDGHVVHKTDDVEADTPHEEICPMEKFDKLSGIAAPMPLINIDTDMIIPKVFLKTIKRSGLGVNLFDEMRYDRQGNEIADFVLNQPAYREASILVAGDNFGCGSSREHAPWAIADFGIRCVISTSFADIFYNNCFKNGILPIVLPEEQRDALMKDAEKGANARIEVDLEAQTVTSSDGTEFKFEVDSFKKHCLMNGLDDIGLTMEKAKSIDTFEATANQSRPWV